MVTVQGGLASGVLVNFSKCLSNGSLGEKMYAYMCTQVVL